MISESVVHSDRKSITTSVVGVFWPLLQHHTELVVSFQGGKGTPSLCMSALLKILSLSFLFTLLHTTCCVGLVSDKHHASPHPSLSIPSVPPFFLVCLYCCAHVRITSWACGEHGLKPQTMRQGIFLASLHECVISQELHMEYESSTVVLQ